MEEQHHDRAAPLRWIPTDVSRGPQADRKLLDSTAEANAQQPRHGDAGAGLARRPVSVCVCVSVCLQHKRKIQRASQSLRMSGLPTSGYSQIWCR